MDQIDFQILRILQENSRKSWKEIGELLHMSGQGIGNRIHRMENEGVIEKFTVIINDAKIGKTIQAFITVFMKTTAHHHFHSYIRKNPAIIEAHKISGEGCYLLKASVSSHEELNAMLDDILKYGNYRVNLSIGKI